jgi:hypothetical protein
MILQVMSYFWSSSPTEASTAQSDTALTEAQKNAIFATIGYDKVLYVENSGHSRQYRFLNYRSVFVLPSWPYNHLKSYIDSVNLQEYFSA